MKRRLSHREKVIASIDLTLDTVVMLPEAAARCQEAPADIWLGFVSHVERVCGSQTWRSRQGRRAARRFAAEEIDRFGRGLPARPGGKAA